MHRLFVATAAVFLVLMCHAPLASAQDGGDHYGALMGGIYRPDQARDDRSSLALHGVYGISSGDYRAWEFNAFTQSSRNNTGTGDDKALGVGLDLNWGRREPGHFFLLTGLGADYEQNIGDNSHVNPYANLGGGLYLPFTWPNDLVRLEARWNGVLGDDATGQSGLLNDFRLQVGVAFGARRAPPPEIRAARAAEHAIADQDQDGVADVLDRCADTPAWVRVEPTGCGPDSDHDGVFEGLDRCPATPAGETVNRDGCSLSQADADADGVADLADLCPGTAAGVKVKADGCPEGGTLVLADIHFETDSSLLAIDGLHLLDTVAASLRERGDVHVEIQGYTDNVGPPAYNLRLSDKRVRAAREFLIYRGIAPERISSRGFGEQSPRASNASEQGRAQNRRIEFKVEEQRSEEGDQVPAADDISLISLGDEAP